MHDSDGRVSTRLHAKTCVRRLIIPRESGNFPFYRSPTFHNPWHRRESFTLASRIVWRP